MKIFWLEQTDTDLPAGGTSMAPVDAEGQDGWARRLQWVAPGTATARMAVSRRMATDSDGAKPELEWLSARELDQAQRLALRQASRGLAPGALDGKTRGSYLPWLARLTSVHSPKSKCARRRPVLRKYSSATGGLPSRYRSATALDARSVPLPPPAARWGAIWRSSNPTVTLLSPTISLRRSKHWWR